MKIYIASNLKNAVKVREVRDMLINYGHHITYDWTTHGLVTDKSKLTEIAINEYRGVCDCDALVVLWPAGFGTHVEFGVALANNKPIHFYIPDDQDIEMKSFYFMPNVIIYKDLNDLLSHFEDSK
jgi:nucleoside 2-deoxyribosyltransferase